MAIAQLDDGTVWHSASVPYKGALKLLSDEVWTVCQTLFATRDDLVRWLAVVHFRNMAGPENSIGQEYPIIMLGDE